MENVEQLKKELEFLQQTNESLSRSVEELISLKDNAKRILHARQTDDIMESFLDAVKAIASTEKAHVIMLDDQGVLVRRNEVTRRIVRGVVGKPALPKEVLDWVIKEEKASTVPVDDDRFMIAVPMIARKEAVGVLLIDATENVDAVTPHVLEKLSHIAYQAAAALLNARLYTKLEGQLRMVSEARSYLANVLESINHGIVVLNVHGRLTQLNRNAGAMIEVVEEDVLGAPHESFMRPEMAQVFSEMLAETVENGFALERQFTQKLSQGIELPLAIGTAVLRDEDLRMKGVIFILRDMTASRELERLRRLDDLKSQFVANVSHELRTPLTSIRAYTEALQDMVNKDETALSFLNVVMSESDRLLALIEDLLNVSRIESGKLRLNLTMVKPREIIDEIMGMSKVQSTKHKLVVEIADDLPELLMDKDKMKEVSINLVSNAIKYSPEGGNVWIRMSMHEGNLRMEIQDQGMGIAQEHLGHIFDAFYRVDSTLTYKVSGTGLGLAIVKSIVEAHQGTIRVESEPGKGSRFYVLLPVRRSAKIKDIEAMS
jgi:two-component system phosphate regulon sensor histidine kinase PhoR